jgi:hypothetical protein
MISEDVLSLKKEIKVLKLVTLVLVITSMLVIVSISLLYYFKVDYFLPPALVMLLVPLITQVHAAFFKKKRLSRRILMHERVEHLSDDEKEKLNDLK